MGKISDIGLLASLSDERRQRYSSALSWRNYLENELVIDIDDPSTDVLFLVTGSVRIVHRAEIGKEIILGELGPGSYFGEMSAIDGMPRSASVTTLQRSRIATMRAGSFMSLLTQEPDVCRSVLGTLVSRIRTLNTKLAEHAYLTAVERLNAELLRLSRPREGDDGERSISPPPTGQELAERIGSRREVVARALSALERDGLLERTKGAIVLPRPGEINRRISQPGLRVPVAD